MLVTFGLNKTRSERGHKASKYIDFKDRKKKVLLLQFSAEE